MNLQGFKELSFDESLAINGGSLNSILSTVSGFFSQIIKTVDASTPLGSTITTLINTHADTILNAISTIGALFVK
jgi:hypothetical protein